MSLRRPRLHRRPDLVVLCRHRPERGPQGSAPPQELAPGFYTGYAVKTMPGAREAIAQKAWAEAEREAARIASALERETALIEAATGELEKLR